VQLNLESGDIRELGIPKNSAKVALAPDNKNMVRLGQVRLR
jgi:hypothetical protein